MRGTALWDKQPERGDKQRASFSSSSTQPELNAGKLKLEETEEKKEKDCKRTQLCFNVLTEDR